jgi:hypothetical protein
MWKDICYLGTYVEAENALGEISNTVTYSESYIFCKKKSVRQSEFYQAAVTDYKPSIVLIVKTADYSGEKYVNFNNEEFTVIRTFQTTEEDIEIVLESGVRHGDT